VEHVKERRERFVELYNHGVYIYVLRIVGGKIEVVNWPRGFSSRFIMTQERSADRYEMSFD